MTTIAVTVRERVNLSDVTAGADEMSARTTPVRAK